MSKDSEKCEKNKKNLCQPFFQGVRQFRHGTALGTYIGRDFHRQFMGIGHLLPAENGSGEGCRERVTGSHGEVSATGTLGVSWKETTPGVNT